MLGKKNKIRPHYGTGLGPFSVTLCIVFAACFLVLLYASSGLLGFSFFAGLLLSAGLIALQLRAFRAYRQLTAQYDNLLQQHERQTVEYEALLDSQTKAQAQVHEKEQEQSDRLRTQNMLIDELQGENLEDLSNSYFHILAREWELVQGLTFLRATDEDKLYTIQSTYAYFSLEDRAGGIHPGETLTGQVIFNQEPLYLSDLPPSYSIVASGLGRCAPSYLFILPLTLPSDPTGGAVELAFFRHLEPNAQSLIGFLTNAYASQLEKLGYLGSDQKEEVSR